MSSLPMKKQLKMWNSNEYQLKLKNKDFIQDSESNQSSTLLSKDVWGKSHDKKPVGVSRQTKKNPLKTFRIALLEYSFDSEPQKMKINTNMQVTYRLAATYNSLIECVKKLKLEAAKNFQSDNLPIDTHILIGYVNKNWHYPAVHPTKPFKIVCEIAKEFADKQLSQAELTPSFYQIFISLNLAKQSNVRMA
jgi:hypothetical protein